MHVDASALTAMLLREPERDEFIDRLTLPGNKTTSAVSVLETIMAVRRALGAGTRPDGEATSTMSARPR